MVNVADGSGSSAGGDTVSSAGGDVGADGAAQAPTKSRPITRTTNISLFISASFLVPIF